MDAKRYARVRDIFLEAEELPVEDQQAYVRREAGDDVELIEEVMSLLGEHDPEDARREGEQAARLPVPGGGAPKPSRGSQSDQPTMTNSQRTYAAPKQYEDSYQQDVAARGKASGKTKRQPSPKTLIWRKHAAKRRRFNMWWVWISAIVPTFIVGYLTYRNVDGLLRRTLREEMAARVDSVALSADRFLDQKASLIRSWSRQGKIRESVVELAEIVDQGDAGSSEEWIETLRSGPQSEAIQSQLSLLSGNDLVEFTVWGRDHQVLASSTPDKSDVGSDVPRSLSAELTFAMRGETVLVGPRIVVDAEDPKVLKPAMSMIVPIENDSSEIVAVMQVRNFGMFKEFNGQFRTNSLTTDQDAYAVSASGRMITESSVSRNLVDGISGPNSSAKKPSAQELPAAAGVSASGRGREKAGQLVRVSDPGIEITLENRMSIDRSVKPLTLAAAGVTAQKNDILVDPYPNYVGRNVVGGWRWLGDWQIGVIVERPAAQAFGPASVVQKGFLALVALLSVTAFATAAMIAKRSSLLHAAVHPLSKYDMMEELGSGGMGIVYRARHKQLGRDTALKILRSDRRNREDRLRFDREAKLAATLMSPHSVMIYDYGVASDSEAFCVMELLHGLTLYEAVARSGYQSIGRSLSILRQICDAVGEAHDKGLMHRDLKPQNVMMSLDPSVGDWAVVFDFGLAKPLEHDPDVFQTSETVWAGTPMYMAPERFREPSVMDPRSDIYSIGCIAYFLLSGRPPFAECDPEAMFALILSEHPIQISTHRGDSFPADVNQFVQKCMAKDAADRFTKVSDLVTELDRLATFYPWSNAEARTWWEVHGGSV